MKRLRFFLLVVIFLSSAAQGQANEAGVQIWIPAKDTVFGGLLEDIKLEATLYVPKGSGPFPVLVFNHGYTGGTSRRIKYDALAQEFVTRGIAVVMPMRRGLASSGGSRNEPYTCDIGQNNRGVDHSIQDVDAVLAYVKETSFLDANRLLIGGQSRGGMLSLVYAARRPALPFKGVINFVGTWNGDRNCSEIDELLFKEAGGLLKIPTLWLYGENDSYNSNQSIARYAEIFKNVGGDISFHLYKHDFWNGHNLLVKGAKYWSIDLDQFLDRLEFLKQP